MITQPNDQYGRVVTSQDNGDGTTTYTVYDALNIAAFTLTQPSNMSIDQVYDTINAMPQAAPD